jgi:lantibiotic modifying enzyme
LLNLKADIYRGEESLLGFVARWNLEFVGKSRYRAIDKALLGEHPDMVQLLLTSGANTGRSGALLGESLLSFAVHDRRKDMALLLIRHGAVMETGEDW